MVRAHVRSLDVGAVQIARALYESEDMCVAYINSLLPTLLPLVATTAVRSLTRTCRIWRSDASGEASGR